MRLFICSLVIGMLLLVPTQFSIAGQGSNEGHRPQDGGRRMMHLIHEQGQHLPVQAWQHGAPKVMKNVQKNPRSNRAHEAINTGSGGGK